MRIRTATLPHSNTFLRVALVILAALISFSAPLSASAQVLTGTSFETETGDHAVEWNDNWIATLSSEDEFSTMLMLEGQIMIYSVMFLHDPNLGLSERVIYNSLSGVLTSSFDAEPTQSVEWEGEDGSFNGAHIIPLSGIDFVIYMRVDPATESSGPVMQFAAAPSRAFPLSLTAMQQELTVDGVSAFDGADGEEVMAQLDLETADAEESDSAAPTQAEPAPSTTAPNSSRPGSDSTRQPRSAHIQDEESTGGTYISSNAPYEVTYSDAWVDMAESDSTVGEFSLSGGSNRVVVSFTGRSTTETNREAFFQDIVARESRYSGFVGSVIKDDRLTIATWTSENELAVLEYVFVDDLTVVTIMVTVTSSNPERYVGTLEEIELNGSPILPDLEDVLNQAD